MSIYYLSARRGWMDEDLSPKCCLMIELGEDGVMRIYSLSAG